MKRIALFLDGTWNVPTADHPTNVWELYEAVLPVDGAGVEQRRIYREGVGTGNGKTGVARSLDKFFGGAFGWGLTENIARVYEELCETYEVGDEIHLFGFSRGAYSARSLAGLIRNCGILSEPTPRVLNRAIRLYRDRRDTTAPDTERAMAFRREHSPAVATSQAEIDWRVAQGDPAPHLLRIPYVGVWDTVGALGVPSYYRVLSRVFNRRYDFHDLTLSRMIVAARHAVAIDEQRPSFAPTLWEATDAAGGASENYLQEWFPGVHGSVGGGGDLKQLSHGSLLWIAQGAVTAGLALDRGQTDSIAAQVSAVGPLVNVSKPPTWVWRLLSKRKADRKGPTRMADASAITSCRWASDPSYRPPPLTALAGDLDARAADPDAACAGVPPILPEPPGRPSEPPVA